MINEELWEENAITNKELLDMERGIASSPNPKNHPIHVFQAKRMIKRIREQDRLLIRGLVRESELEALQATVPDARQAIEKIANAIIAYMAANITLEQANAAAEAGDLSTSEAELTIKGYLAAVSGREVAAEHIQ